jgi:Rrf2 family transcriptional regulator, iron-sulfur cluster assembly transcription factor
MMSLSQTTGYAVQALACLDDAESQPCFIRDVAQCTGLPRAYLAQIINRLAHSGIILAKRGYRGGIQLARPAAKISLLDVVEAVEGKEWIGPCLLGIERCGADFVCPTRKFWLSIRRQIQRKLRTTTLAHFFGARGFRELRRPSKVGALPDSNRPGPSVVRRVPPAKSRRGA